VDDFAILDSHDLRVVIISSCSNVKHRDPPVSVTNSLQFCPFNSNNEC